MDITFAIQISKFGMINDWAKIYNSVDIQCCYWNVPNSIIMTKLWLLIISYGDFGDMYECQNKSWKGYYFFYFFSEKGGQPIVDCLFLRPSKVYIS